MARKTYIVDGRQFGTQADYQDAMVDKELIDKLRTLSKDYDVSGLRDLAQKIESKKIRFRTLLGQDFSDELRERIRKKEKSQVEKNKIEKSKIEINKKDKNQKADAKRRTPEQEAAFEAAVEKELRKRERTRKLFLLLSAVLAVGFLGAFGIYAFQEQRIKQDQERLGELIGGKISNERRMAETAQDPAGSYKVTLDGDRETPDILEEYETIYKQHKKLIGWLKFDDKDIGGKYGYPVMQTQDNEFFLSHNSELKSDKNGAIFLDMNCDVLKPSTNFILYGHHMKSGAMFGNLDHYEKESYWEKYPYVSFDTIYEKGIYQVMYVFRSHVYSEEEIAFKYYQFVDAISETEFDSNMAEMAKMSLYDTHVTAKFGDQLLTLSTCDYQERDGRFVVVCKKVKARE